MKYDNNIREEELKNRVREDFFSEFNCARIIGSIDFAVKIKRPADYMLSDEDEYLLWAEAKKKEQDDYIMLAQLILTIGKARTFEKLLPPPFLGCFDCSRITLIPYANIQDIFYQNDFNWSVTPSNRETKEFQQVYNKVKGMLENETSANAYTFDFDKDEKLLKDFIRTNFILGKVGTTKTRIDKNNFIFVYNRWLELVKPTIALKWDIAKRKGIIDGDFYLADLLSIENKTLKEKLYVLLRSNKYEMDRDIDDMGAFSHRDVDFSDNQRAHRLFWDKYDRPPATEYWDYIVERRDLLIPQDIRERRGSFFTPQIWVELSQKYLANTFGIDWQDEYYVWDCAAGTGNLLAGLINKYNVWASTLDKQDVDVMHDRIDTMNKNSRNGNGSNLLHDHVFQFDFLNDSFDKLPKPLQNIINDEQKRKKLIIYINPPYAEAGSTTAVVGTGNIKSGVATEQKTKNRYQPFIGAATNEISAQFMARIHHEIAGCKLSLFSKLKFVCTQHFITFRKFFKADFKAGFVVHANTFDNVSGKFPIAFTVWDLNGKRFPDHIEVDIPENGGKKIFWDGYFKSINNWIKQYNTSTTKPLGLMIMDAPDFQKIHQPILTLTKGSRHAVFYSFNANNFITGCIYFAVRLCIEPTWLNDRDQFIHPNNDGWKTDTEFQNDCLAFTLFHGQNRISAGEGINHWIPFTEREVNSREKFDSHFVRDFIDGKIKQDDDNRLFDEAKPLIVARKFSPEAVAVFDTGRELWKYYHKLPDSNVNASLYDIREHFQGRNDAGRMNATSDDDKYNLLLFELREKLKLLALKIEPKVYEYGFLKV